MPLAVGFNQILYQSEMLQGEHPHLQQHPDWSNPLPSPIDKGLFDLKCNVAAQLSINDPREHLKVLKINNPKQGLARGDSVCVSAAEYSW